MTDEDRVEIERWRRIAELDERAGSPVGRTLLDACNAIEELQRQIKDAHHDLAMAVGDTYTTVNSAAFEAVRQIATLQAQVTGREDRMTPEELTEARRLLDASTADIPGDETDKHIELRLHERTVAERTFMANMAPALLDEVKQLREQVEVTRRVGEAETARAAYEAMDTERRGQESRRAVENVTLADLKREHTTALDHVRRLHAQWDHVARSVREFNPAGHDPAVIELLVEIREAFAVIDGLRTGGEPDQPRTSPEPPAHAGSVWECTRPECFDDTCGDCLEGRCHGSGPCGCARHEASVQARQWHEGGEG